MQCATTGEVVELRAAREAVGQDHGVRTGSTYGGQQVVLGDGHARLVVAELHPEVACQPAAAADPLHLRAGAGQQRGVGLPPDDRVVVAVRLGHDLDAGQVGRRPLPCLHPGGKELRERLDPRAHLGGPGVVEQLDGVLPDDARQLGSRPMTGVPLAT